MNKAEFIEALKSRMPKNLDGLFIEGMIHGISVAIDLASQLPDDGEITQGKGEPELLPFKWPVPDGYEVVFMNEPTDVPDPLTNVQEPYDNQTAAKCRYGWDIYFTGNLFLRPVPPEIIEAWVNYYPDGVMGIHQNEKAADMFANQMPEKDRVGPAICVQFPKPKGI